MLFVLVTLIPVFLHLFGYHCNSHLEVETTSTFNLLDNIGLAQIDPLEKYNSSKYSPYKRTILTDCTAYVRQVSGTLYHTCTDGNNTGCVHALLAARHFWSDTPQCLNATNYSVITISNPSLTRSESDFYIFSDAYRKSPSEINWFNRWATCSASDCVPPEHFAWNHTDNTFTCLDPKICGLGSTKIVYKIDEALANAGAKRLYSDKESDISYKSAIGVKCDKEGKPNIYVFKIPIFDYKLWMAFIVLGMLFFFLSKINEF